ncbi:MAG: hypothetical protein HW421_547 [Ignavibacteria bacterium]|nr:hypothetical protein [Ignavibacteria bacterium]
MKNIVNHLEISNFKSIKNLKMDCKRVNIFIGGPDVGKSNILEALGLFSLPFGVNYYAGNIKDFIRYDKLYQFFYNFDFSKPIEVTTDKFHCRIDYNNRTESCIIKYLEPFHDDSFIEKELNVNSSGQLTIHNDLGNYQIFFYRYMQAEHRIFNGKFLMPPLGWNIQEIIFINQVARSLTKKILESNNREPVFIKPDNTLVQQINVGIDERVQLPYILFSDGMKHLLFNLAAIMTNTDSVVILEEPESHSFPYYSGLIAEKIAESKTNQFFIATHNPYFLDKIIEKTPLNELNIFIVDFINNETTIKSLKEKEIIEIIENDIDTFFNLDRFSNEK